MNAAADPTARVPSAPSLEDVQRRQDRLALLEAAARALAPSLEIGAVQALEEPSRRITASLASLRSHRRSLEAGMSDPGKRAEEARELQQDLLQIDDALETQARALRATVDAAPLASLRAAAPEMQARGRDDILALLDVVGMDEAELDRRFDLLDYLTTLLASEERDGRRYVARDPVMLTPRFQALCERIGATTDEDLPALEQEFVAAARRCEQGSIATVVSEMRVRKGSLGRAALAPQVIRSIVFYNTAVWNALRARLQTERKPAPPAPAPSAIPRLDALERTTPPAATAPVPRPDPAPAPPPSLVSREAAAPPAQPRTPAEATKPVPPGNPGRSAPRLSNAEIHWMLGSRGEEAGVHIPGPEESRASSRRWLPFALAGLAAAAGVVAWLSFSTPPNAARMLSSAELREAPSWLASGYRDAARTGGLFVGSVGTDWERMSPDERTRGLDSLATSFEASGVREILLYDGDQRLVAHHIENLPPRVDL